MRSLIAQISVLSAINLSEMDRLIISLYIMPTK